MNILIIEDNPGDLYLFKRTIQNHAKKPYKVMDVENGRDALDFIQKTGNFKDAFAPDLIFLDWNIPIKHGRDVLEFLKSHAEYRVIPVIVFSTSENYADIISCYKGYANGYFRKPNDYHEFSNMMENVMRFWSMITFSPSVKADKLVVENSKMS
ncbi:MAG: response regulator [Bacteroidia bacterium]